MNWGPMISLFRFSLAGALLSLPALSVGCSAEVGEDGADSGATDAELLELSVLDNALLNEGQFAEAGFVLEGRAWVAPDVGLSFYVDQQQNRIYSLLMRGGTDSEQPVAEDGESFAEFVARKGGGKELLVDVGSTGPNAVLFDAVEGAAKLESINRLTAVGRNDYCPRAWFDNVCTQWAGLNVKLTFPLTWKLTDLTAARTQSLGAVTGVVSTACADLGTIDYSLTLSNARWGTIPGSIALTLNQGNAQQAYAGSGWDEEEYCKTRVLGVCVDYEYRIKFQHFTASTRVSPRAGAEAHFCGKMAKNADYNQGDLSCYSILTCPTQCRPGTTDSLCRL